MRLLLLADRQVGREITRWLLESYAQDVALVVTTAANEIYDSARSAQVDCLVYSSAEQVCARVRAAAGGVDLGVLAWWPTLVRQPLLGLPRLGFVNTHPSLLPHNRGKHYNFWALVEQAAFGVTLHFVGGGVDDGDIVAQRRVPYGWEDTGGSLHAKAADAMAHLFKETYPLLRTLQIPRHPQDVRSGSFHLAKELEPASRIQLDRQYRARDLLNLLRARTFPGHPACWFRDGEDEYEVRVEITKRRADATRDV